MTFEPDKLNKDEDKEATQSEAAPVAETAPEPTADEIALARERLEKAKTSAEQNDAQELAETRPGLGLPEHAEHNHGSEESQADKDKLATEIIGRAKDASPKIQKIAEDWASRNPDGVEGVRNDLESIIEGSAGEETGGFYSSLNAEEAKSLYQIFYGENFKPRDSEERRQWGEKLAEDMIAHKMPEGALPESPVKTQEIRHEAPSVDSQKPESETELLARLAREREDAIKIEIKSLRENQDIYGREKREQAAQELEIELNKPNAVKEELSRLQELDDEGKNNLRVSFRNRFRDRPYMDLQDIARRNVIDNTEREKRAEEDRQKAKEAHDKRWFGLGKYF